jgi:hypothetical protein
VKARGDIPIILCCSEDDEPALAKVVDELLREGMAPELVPGVEFDSNLMSSAVDAAANGALFVLCISPALDKTIARKLTGLFSARSGRGQKIISTAFTPSRPLAILPSIRGALKEMRLSEDEVERLEDETPERACNLRDVVEAFAEPEAAPPPSNVSQVDAEALARELAMGMAEAEAILERREQQARPVPRRPTPRRPTPAPVEPRRATPAPITPPRRAPVSDARREPSVGMVERHLESQLPHVEALVTDGDPSRKIPRSMIPPPPRALADEPQGNRWLLAFAGVDIAGIVVLALLQLFRPGEGDAARRGAGVGAGVPASAGDGGARQAGDRKRDDGAGEVAAKQDEPAPTTAVPGPSDLVGAEGGAAKDDAGAAKDDGGAAKDEGGATPTPAEGGAVEPATTDAVPDATNDVPPPPKGAVSKRDIAEAALALAEQEGKLARVGKLYVLRTAGEELTWSEANSRCAGRRINGVGGFHLPSANEIMRLRGARLVGSGTWWTRKKAADDEAIAIDAASGATHVYLTIEPAGRAICVRTL